MSPPELSGHRFEDPTLGPVLVVDEPGTPFHGWLCRPLPQEGWELVRRALPAEMAYDLGSRPLPVPDSRVLDFDLVRVVPRHCIYCGNPSHATAGCPVVREFKRLRLMEPDWPPT